MFLRTLKYSAPNELEYKISSIYLNYQADKAVDKYILWWRKKKSIKTDPKLTQMNELADKYIKTITATVLRMFK